MCTPSSNNRQGERGQATIVLVGVLALAAAAAVGLAILGEAMVHRAHARNAADAGALAAAVDAEAADVLSSWYTQQNIVIERSGSRTTARSGPSQAAAWASTDPARGQPAPALVAIVARAEQLLGDMFTSVQWQPMAVILTDRDAARMSVVAADLGLCELDSPGGESSGVIFELC